jgi:von Willebrand factor type A domain
MRACTTYHTSSIRLPLALANGDNWNPTDPSVVEAICFSRRLDSWFVQKRANDADFWKGLLQSREPPLNSMFFGSHHGPFRIYPARQSPDCGDYDARLRPWYVAGSSGPKNVVLLVDISGVMGNGDRLKLLQQASQRVVNATTIHDRITVVSFSSTIKAYTTVDGYMLDATEVNKVFLNKAIANFTALGGTNYYEAFDTAFKVLDATIANELITACHTAVIFLTDDGAGNQILGKSLTEVKSLVATRMKNVSDAIQKPTLLFTYSLSSPSSSSSNNNAFDATNVSSFPAELACEVEHGVWTQISNDNDLPVALSNYYRLLALGFGQDPNVDTFVAWVDPYLFATPSNGTTVSRPVYDRTRDPPVFLGVVGINFDLRAFDAALSSGITVTAKETIRQEVVRQIGYLSNNSSCPRVLNPTACELATYQASSHGYEGNRQSISFCDRGCTDPTGASFQEPVCEDGGPNDLWNNTHFLLHEASYTDRFCCKNSSTAENVATPTEEDVCLAAAVPTNPPTGSLEITNSGGGGLSRGAIAGIALSFVAVLAGLLLYGWKRKRGVCTRDRRGAETSSSPIITPPPPPPPATNPSYAMWETTAPTAP